MNSAQVNRAVTAGRSNMLGRLLTAEADDEQVILELYLCALSRQPSEEEIAQLLAYRDEVDDRQQAFEDALWALINSTEFQHRR